MLYTSEITGKSYKTVKELEADEKLAKEEEEKKSKALEVKKTRAKEVESAYLELQKVREDAYSKIAEAEKKYLELRDAFAKDYNGYHMTYVNNNGQKTITFEDLVNSLWNW